MIIRTHAPGCLYTTSSSARCTCHWAKVIAEEEQDLIHPTSGRLLSAKPIKTMTDKPITFTDEQGNEWTLRRQRDDDEDADAVLLYDATTDDLARAGYTPSAENAEVQRLCMEAARRTRELEALRALYDHVREYGSYDRWEELCETTGALLKAIDEARE